MKGGKRAATPWNLFVKKIYREGKAKNSNYAFKDALKDASKRKGEMGSHGHEGHHHATKKHSKSKRRHTRKHRSHRRH
jgi:hypothetical protein